MLGSAFEQTMIRQGHKWYILSFNAMGLLVLKIMFYLIWSSLSCGPDAAITLAFPLRMKALHKLWL